MTSSQFDLDLTSKPLNLSLLRFNEQSGFENLGLKWSKCKRGSLLKCLSYLRTALVRGKDDTKIKFEKLLISEFIRSSPHAHTFNMQEN